MVNEDNCDIKFQLIENIMELEVEQDDYKQQVDNFYRSRILYYCFDKVDNYLGWAGVELLSGGIGANLHFGINSKNKKVLKYIHLAIKTFLDEAKKVYSFILVNFDERKIWLKKILINNNFECIFKFHAKQYDKNYHTLWQSMAYNNNK